MSEKEAIKMLDRIRDEDCGVWTQEAWDSFDMAMAALDRQRSAKRIAHSVAGFLCAVAFFASLVAFACVDSGNRGCVMAGFALLAFSVIMGNIYGN